MDDEVLAMQVAPFTFAANMFGFVLAVRLSTDGPALCHRTLQHNHKPNMATWDAIDCLATCASGMMLTKG